MRLSSKAFLVDPDGRLLLLDSTDPARPGTRWWELPGGGVEPGESELEALVREVLEETGLAVEPVAVGPLQWTQKASFQWLGRRHEVRLHGRVARVRDLTTAPTALTEHEVGTVLGPRRPADPAHQSGRAARHGRALLPAQRPDAAAAAAGRRARRGGVRRLGLTARVVGGRG